MLPATRALHKLRELSCGLAISPDNVWIGVHVDNQFVILRKSHRTGELVAAKRAERRRWYGLVVICTSVRVIAQRYGLEVTDVTYDAISQLTGGLFMEEIVRNRMERGARLRLDIAGLQQKKLALQRCSLDRRRDGSLRIGDGRLEQVKDFYQGVPDEEKIVSFAIEEEILNLVIGEGLRLSERAYSGGICVFAVATDGKVLVPCDVCWGGVAGGTCIRCHGQRYWLITEAAMIERLNALEQERAAIEARLREIEDEH